MRSLKSPLHLNVLVEMAVSDNDFKTLLMRDPLRAVQTYNSRMREDGSRVCNLPRLEVEMLQRVAGVTADFRQFCGLLVEERDRSERIEEQRQRMEVLVPGGITYYEPETSLTRRSRSA